MNNFFTDEAWNLYDINKNLIAYAWTYQFDEQWNIFLNEQNNQENNFKNQENQENISNNNLKYSFNKIEKYLKKTFWLEKIEKHHEKWIKEKDLNVKVKDKFDSELTPSEDLKRFIWNIANISKFFSDQKKFSKNEARWKLFFIWKKDIVEFLDQLAILLNSWIRLVDAVVIMQKQSKVQSTKILYRSLASKMWNWMHLSEAFADYDYIFPWKWVHMIKAAEKSWKMSDVLTDLAKEEMNQLEFISKIKWAMIYPWILISMAILVFWWMMTFMVPALEKSFWSIDKLPKLTQNVIIISHWMQNNTFLLFFYPILGISIFIFLKSQFITIKKIVDWISLRFPIFWWISKKKNVVMFANNLSLMLSAWVVISKSLTIIAETMPSILFQQEVHRIRRWINDWKTMSQMMWLSWKMNNDEIKEDFYFWLEIAQMIKIWEQTWNTLWVLKKIADVNNAKLDNIVRNLTSMLEPMITVIIWWMVWTLIIAFMIPMMSSFKNV